MSSILEKQVKALKKMLTASPGSDDTFSRLDQAWRVLILDRRTQDIIGPLLGLKELRELGITLHLNILSKRDSIPDVPAVYFVQPSEENISRICEDFRNQTYDSYMLNFVSPISRILLEKIAHAALENNCASQVSRVYDQYMNFIALDDDLVVYKGQADDVSFFELNRPDVKDTEMDHMLESIVDSLFSIVVTLGSVPIIRCGTNDAAERVSHLLEARIRDALRDPRCNLFSSHDASVMYGSQRPLLILLDRSMDLATPLHHTWTYQALLHDVADYHLNKVVLDLPSQDEAKTKKKLFDLNKKDKFWSSHKLSPFPEVAEAIQEELENYKASEGEMKKLKNEMGLGDNEAEECMWLLGESTSKISTAVTSLPEMLVKKKNLDTHTTIATKLLDIIKNRHIDNFFEIEEKIMAKGSIFEDFADSLSKLGGQEDKARLFLLALLCGANVTNAQENQFLAILQEHNVDISAVKYIKRWKSLNCLTANRVVEQYAGGGTKTVEMFSKLIGKSSKFVMEGVKNLVVKRHNLPTTRIVDALMERKSTPEIDGFLYFDPKMVRQSGPIKPVPVSKTSYQHAIVFMIGGGSCMEYENIAGYCKSKSTPNNSKRIVYGCTELMNPLKFLSYLNALGSGI